VLAGFLLLALPARRLLALRFWAARRSAARSAAAFL
jgi:hypothetical protein